MKTFYEYELDGKRLAFHRDSVIHLQESKGRGSYKTTNTFAPEHFARAILLYKAKAAHNGWNKRLVCWSLNKPVIARHRSG